MPLSLSCAQWPQHAAPQTRAPCDCHHAPVCPQGLGHQVTERDQLNE